MNQQKRGMAQIDRRLCNGSIYAQAAGFRLVIWQRTGYGSRKQHECIMCDVTILVGALAYRPISKANDRMLRICVGCAGD